ncbi:glycosyltransferase family 39 protein [Hymenobacter jejuensis]|uniref:Glycosyltransferase family 39 protein n=2 Tax=Hymenobacter jejuensis TaxID=2502781 RepID=A0A5B8A6H4_9BACT|nr:glycosyltransferase family 39 protein [Hymenobacter jejuensis]
MEIKEISSRAPREQGLLKKSLSNSKESKLTHWDYTILVASITGLLLSCIIISSKKYFWTDELFSYYMTSEPSLGRMLAAFHDKLNNTPLLYFLLGWGWDKLFGSAELSLRLFSSLGMAAALLLTWATLRRTYALWATATGTLLVFCTSQVILNQNAEARMYGLFLALSAMAFLLYDNFYRNTTISYKFLIINALVHVAIIHTHLFGGFYSGAILVAFFATDRVLKLYRPKLYLTILLSWISVVFYLPSFLIQADAGKPRTWIPAPDFVDLLDIYNLTKPTWIGRRFLLFIALVLFIYLIRKGNIKKLIKNINILNTEIPVLIFGFCLLIVPIAIWIISLTIKPIFYDRYMIPSAIGWVILFSFVASKTVFSKKNISAISNNPALLLAPILALTFTVTYPIIFAKGFRKQNYPGTTDMLPEIAKKYAHLPKVVTSSGTFLERNYYAPDRLNYFFILDWKSAVDPNSGTFPPQSYKHMEAWKRNFPQFFQDNVVTSEDFLSHHDRFLVIDYPDYLKRCPLKHAGLHVTDLWTNYLECPQWVEVRLLNDKNYKVTFLSNEYWFSILLVEKIKPNL